MIEINSKDLLGAMSQYFQEKTRELDFFTRVFSGGIEKYVQRLKNIGFEGKASVLDAGAGFGQWTAALSRLNKRVIALELNPFRCEILQKILYLLQIRNVTVIEGNIENIPFKDACFDAAFSYSVIYQADWKRTLEEFGRVLHKQGLLYLAANGIGWALFNIKTNRNPSIDFSPRFNALKSIIKTFSLGILFRKGDRVLFPGGVKRKLKQNGFEKIRLDGDGRLNIHHGPPLSFYASKVYGLTNAFEILAERGG